jgi:hypothetical protein
MDSPASSRRRWSAVQGDLTTGLQAAISLR